MRAFLVALLTLTAVAGCLGDDRPLEPMALDDADAAYAAGDMAANLDKIGHWQVTGGEEVDAWEDYLFVDRGSQIEILHLALADGAVEFHEVGTYTGSPGPKDVKVSDDGNWMFLGNDEQLAEVADTPIPTRVGGIYTVNVTDKAAPVQTHYHPIGPLRGAHMVFYHARSDGSEYVYGANAEVSINRFDRASGSLTEASRYAPNVLTEVNRQPDVIDAYYQLYTHDMFVDEEADGQVLLYTASWDAGLHIVDVTDAANPTQLGAWNDFPAGHSGNLHTVVSDWIGDRRITAGAVEVGFEIVGGVPYLLGTEKSILYVWDTTDPSNIQLLGFWENPDGLTPGQGGLVMTAITGDELLSTHNIQLEHGRIYMAHYGLGIWVIDVSTPELQAAPQTLAFFDEEGMNVWDILLHDGVVYSSGAAGVQAFHFPLDTFGSPAFRGRA